MARNLIKFEEIYVGMSCARNVNRVKETYTIRKLPKLSGANAGQMLVRDANGAEFYLPYARVTEFVTRSGEVKGK